MQVSRFVSLPNNSSLVYNLNMNRPTNEQRLLRIFIERFFHFTALVTKCRTKFTGLDIKLSIRLRRVSTGHHQFVPFYNNWSCYFAEGF